MPIAESGPAFQPIAAAEAEVAAEEDMVDLTSPSLKELASDVSSAAGTAPDEEEPAEVEDEAAEDEVRVRSVETVSAIDLVMDDSCRDS
ncbi:MAG: hypothetical protein H0T69_02750 [Thermoleophilaceae bacterium]|nr:hypothetical protein [Thermoleophilaceae bacterium]